MCPSTDDKYESCKPYKCYVSGEGLRSVVKSCRSIRRSCLMLKVLVFMSQPHKFNQLTQSALYKLGSPWIGCSREVRFEIGPSSNPSLCASAVGKSLPFHTFFLEIVA